MSSIAGMALVSSTVGVGLVDTGADDEGKRGAAGSAGGT